MTVPSWMHTLFSAIDRRDYDTFVNYLTADGTFRYGSGPVVRGREAVRAAAAGALAPFASVRHEVVDAWERPDAMVVEGRVTYGFANGRSQTLSFVNVFRMQGERIAEYLIYIDPRPLLPSTLLGFVGVARGPFLLLALLLTANGAAAQAYGGAFDWSRTILAGIALLALHVVVNVRNEVSDYQTGIDLATERTPFSGGSGAIPAGLVHLRSARIFGWLAFAVAAVIGIYFLAVIGWPLVPLVLAGIVLTLGYTPWLTSTGFGEIAAGLGLGFLPVVGAAMVQDGSVAPSATAAAVPAFLMTFNLLFLNEFPDEAADLAGGRRNLVHRLGRTGAARLYVAVAVLEIAAIAVAVGLGYMPLWCLLALAPALLLVKPFRWALTEPAAPVPVPALAANVTWNLGTNLLLAVGFVLALVL